MKTIPKYALGATLCAVSLAVFAEQPKVDEENQKLETIIVEESVPINPNSGVLPGEINRSQANNADGGDFLRQMNGISASRFGGRGLEPIIRGQSQTRINVLLDGAYIHGGCPNRMDPPASWAALETYEKVTVLKGVQSVIYGSGGSGGTVLFERDSRALAEAKGSHARGSVAGSSNGVRYDATLDSMFATDKGYVRGFVQLKDMDDYEDGDGNEVRSSYDHKQGGVVMGLTPDENSMIEFTFERNDFADALYPGAGMDSPEEDGNIYRLRYENALGLDMLNNIRVETYLSDVDHLMDNYSLRTAPKYMAWHPKAGQDMKRATPTTSKTSGGRVVLESNPGGINLEYGLDLQTNTRDAVLNNMDSGTAVPITLMWPDVTIQQLGMFAEATSELNDKQSLKYGLRVDRVDVSADKADVKVGMMPMGGHSANMSYQEYYGITAEDETETNVGGLLRFEQQLGNDMSIFMGLSRSVRTADSTERAQNKWMPVMAAAPPMAQATMLASRWIGNPGLDPEQHHQFDIGIGQKSEELTWSAIAFYDKVSDYILRDSARGQDGILQADNADIYRNVDAEIKGLELEGKIGLTSMLDLSGSLAYVDATNTTDNDRNIAQTPPLNGTVQLDYDAAQWGFGSRVRFAAKQDEIDTLSKQEVGETDSWTVLDVYGNYQVNDRLNLRFGVDNVLDETYAEHSSRSNLLDPVAIKVNEPGAIVWLKISANF